MDTQSNSLDNAPRNSIGGGRRALRGNQSKNLHRQVQRSDAEIGAASVSAATKECVSTRVSRRGTSDCDTCLTLPFRESRPTLTTQDGDEAPLLHMQVAGQPQRCELG